MKGGEKMKKTVGILLVLILVFSLFLGCSKSEESGRSSDAEKMDADRLAEGVTVMTGDIGEYEDLVGEAAKDREPPLYWTGPDTFTTPDNLTDTWYWADSTLSTPDWLWLLMLDPDAWENPMVPFVENVEVWLWYQVNETWWFHFSLDMSQADTTSISGYWKWNISETWLEYIFTEMSVVEHDYSGSIDVNTSENLRLSASFDFNVDGSGEGEGRYQNIRFVDFTFYTMPPDSHGGYRGFYTLASEGWNEEHLFPED